ncbi:MAG: TetR/AcrR family transcriptional regulator [Novosphingobium sp.]|nr:TetR/AcrR family transcriptional regulator [Novosphingobium sp.]
MEEPAALPARPPRKAPAAVNEGTETRAAILDATIGIMREEGYAAVSSRRIAARAGLKSKLVHYYFRNMDELFLAVYKRIEDDHFAELTRTLASRKPLRALWRLNMDATNTGMVLELNALASHRKALRAEIARASGRFRMFQAALLERAIDEAGAGAGDDGGGGKGAGLPPMVLSVLALAVSRLLAMDSVMGVTAGHDETLGWIEAFIDHVEDGRPLPAHLEA